MYPYMSKNEDAHAAFQQQTNNLSWKYLDEIRNDFFHEQGD